MSETAVNLAIQVMAYRIQALIEAGILPETVCVFIRAIYTWPDTELVVWTTVCSRN